MNILKNKWVIYGLLALLVTIFYSQLFYNSNKLKEKIAVIEAQNEILEQSNLELKEQRVEIEQKIKDSEDKVLQLYESETRLYNQVFKLESKINNLKSKYEKADNFANSYNGDSIRIYFSNL
jgi:predicted nuclease with TOPRIM domain